MSTLAANLKVITIPTNYNNKMGCDCFPHIDIAPRQPVPESRLHSTTIELRTADNSHPPVKVRVMDICRMPLNKVPLYAAWLSHGMDDQQLRATFFAAGYPPQTEIAIYYYQKL